MAARTRSSTRVAAKRSEEAQLPNPQPIGTESQPAETLRDKESIPIDPDQQGQEALPPAISAGKESKLRH